MVHCRVIGLFKTHTHHSFRGLNRKRRIVSDFLGPLHCRWHKRFRLNNLVDKPHFKTLLGVHRSRPVVQLSRLAPANQSWQQPGPAAFGDDIAFCCDRGHLRRRRSNTHIAKQREIHPIPCCRPVQGTDHRGVNVPHHVNRCIS